MRVCLSSCSDDSWLSAIKQMAHVFQSVLFILQSSTNRTFCHSLEVEMTAVLNCFRWDCNLYFVNVLVYHSVTYTRRWQKKFKTKLSKCIAVRRNSAAPLRETHVPYGIT